MEAGSLSRNRHGRGRKGRSTSAGSGPSFRAVMKFNLTPGVLAFGLATLIPAWRASKTDPVQVLRYE